ncbi:MAG: hypothetical protein NZ602_07735 [Thermoguttaceae bacterium]|nr:hypothetical protein [Thermoguttaceae bacterium]MDW8039586.1 hypothetical protein [Thermoguttaceae bacterium]
MREILFEYELNPTTWVYISSLMTIGIFFKFGRFWSIRNLDLMLLIGFAPGLLMVAPHRAEWVQQFGYGWLFTVSGLMLIRMLLDTLMVRRPLLEPNLSASGLTFTCIAMLVFLTTNVITQSLKESEVTGAVLADHLLQKKELPETAPVAERSTVGYPLFHIFASYSDRPLPKQTPPEQVERALIRRAVTRSVAVLAHLAVVLGLIVIGYRHFENMHTGIAMASLYLLLPYTAQTTPRLDHVLPAALLVWAAEAYRRPAIAGTLIGLAASFIFYPLLLVPLWCGYYWRRGRWRFVIAVGTVLLVMTLSLLLFSKDRETFLSQLRQMYALEEMREIFHSKPATEQVAGFWHFHIAYYRIPVFVAIVVLAGSLAIWPPQKNYATLLSCSGAVMLASQFWHMPGGGTYLNWYLPWTILMIFRPNLEDRIAPSAVVPAEATWLVHLLPALRAKTGSAGSLSPPGGRPSS